MAQNATDDTAAIAPLTDRDIEAAADGHAVEVDELREAVAYMTDEIETWGDEIADDHVPEDHGKYSVSTVITESEDYVCIYVEYGTLARMADRHPEITDEGDVVPAVGWAHNEYARRHGADANALGTMDAAVLPRTETVEEIIEERE